MKFDRRLFINFDWMLLLVVLGISLIGLLNIYSTGFNQVYAKQEFLYVKQIQWIVIGLVFMTAAFCVDYRFISRYAYLIYGCSIVLLVIVFFFTDMPHAALNDGSCSEDFHSSPRKW